LFLVVSMPNWGYFVAKLLSAIGSWLDAGNLRNRVYQLQNEDELMRIALEDIQRMDAEGRIGWIAQETLNNVRRF
jgi:hypothetical protein